MPIDFALVAATYEAGFAAEAHRIKPLFLRLAEAIKVLDRRASEAERATRAYPMLRYRDGALGVSVDARLNPELPRNPSLGFVAGLSEGAQRFTAELGFVRTAADQEFALPLILGPVAAMVSDIADSLARFDRPTIDMFDPNRARFSDLFGVGNLVWSSLLGRENDYDLRVIAGSASAALGFGERADAGSGPKPVSDPLSTIDAIAEGLDQSTAAVLDVILGLPLVTLGLDLALHEGALVVKQMLLTELTSIESEVYQLRVSIVGHLLTAMTFGPLIQAALDVVGMWVGLNAWILSVEIPRWTTELMAGLSELLAGISAWGRWVTKLLEAVRSFVDSIMNLDLLPILLSQIIPAPLLRLLPGMPTLTVSDLIGLGIDAGSLAIRSGLAAWFGTAHAILWLTPGAGRYAAKVKDLGAILDIVLTPTRFPFAVTRLPGGPMGGFPDVYEAMFGGGRRERLLTSVGEFGSGLRASVGGVLAGAGTAASDLSTLSRNRLDAMAVHGSRLNLQRYGASSAAMAHDLFADERALAGQHRQPNALGVAFDDVMAGSGIALAGAVIPSYVGGMKRYWSAQSEAQRHPTSAHILARNGRLAMVRVPRLVVNAPAGEPERELAEVIGARFRTVVTQSYVEGRNRITQLAQPMDAPVTGGARRG